MVPERHTVYSSGTRPRRVLVHRLELMAQLRPRAAESTTIPANGLVPRNKAMPPEFAFHR